ncbi:flagellar basal body rod protein FlgB [Campylobacter sp. RM12920]|uniref:Flagellar basal body rod protein FlgB n=1 Tax=Campylobacter californiensis TaxID=1032243 RepID=A0ABD4JH77_9BACT|nr:flagellar basal body rod protein FlgB [Campylobacter sp. RM12919]MBE2987530.1 flagellar basal body rod protein FlgB [Campylobacter sp. RM12920]
MFVLQHSKSSNLVAEAMSAREMRQRLISGNIANIDTPFYKARDINFETTLRQKADEIYNRSNSTKLDLAQTDDAHIPMVDFPRNDRAQVFLRDGHMARNDANTVDLDIETTELSKNSTMLSALDNAYRRHGSIFRNVIESSGKL